MAGVLPTVCAAIAVPTVFGQTVAPGRDDLVFTSANLEYGGADAQALQGRRLIRPFIQLDHVLFRGLSVVDAGVVNLPKTDHAAVWVRLSPHRP